MASFSLSCLVLVLLSPRLSARSYSRLSPFAIAPAVAVANASDSAPPSSPPTSARLGIPEPPQSALHDLDDDATPEAVVPLQQGSQAAAAESRVAHRAESVRVREKRAAVRVPVERVIVGRDPAGVTEVRGKAESEAFATATAGANANGRRRERERAERRGEDESERELERERE
ncbi:hypothetical protein EDB83DRAFT_2322193 [Lactarius deliciosus]|nr:hypothetical protein EDB83DRAFT_2322193 [Lactarius deliciosus]